jgi:TrmH family RNA methyltransferase
MIKQLPKPTRAQSKLVTSLKHKKYRRLERFSTVEGSKLIEEAISAGVPLHSAYFTLESAQENADLVENLQRFDIEVFNCSPGEMERMSSLKTPPGCLLVYKTDFQPKTRKGNLILGLYQISDPGNLGTLIRSADWFGVSSILLSKDSAELHNPATVRGSMGAVFRIPVETEVDLGERIRFLKKSGWKIVLTVTRQGDPPIALSCQTVLVMSDEYGRLPAKIEEMADYRFTIPRKGEGESLNLAVAGSIVMYVLSDNK